VHPYKTGGADFHLGISADQIAAKELGKYTQLSSLELGLEPQPLAGNCDSGYTCAYMSMSWRGPTSPLPAEINPRTGVRAAVRRRRQHRRRPPHGQAWKHQKSVLDYVTGSLSRLRMRLGTGDKRKLEEYLEACATSSGGSSAPKSRTRRSAAAHRAAERDSRRLRAVHQADDRHAGRRVADRHDARRVVHARPRRQQPGRIARSASRTATTRSRITRTIPKRSTS
jgi:hypothetical protein